MMFRRAAILGTGLMGGSFALAIRKAGFAGRIVGVSSPQTLAKAVAAGVVDTGASLEEAAAQADLIYLSQPINGILRTLERLSGIIRPGTLVTDAGTPAVSDPGFLLVRGVLEAGLEVTAIPGPSAVIMALVLSGLPVHSFTFRGFPPRKPGARRRFARLPEVRLQDSDLHSILDGTLSLYDGRIQDVRLIKLFEADIPVMRLDPEHMRRVFINLFDNALEAMADNTHAKVLQVRTSCSTPQGVVRIEISDTGRGFPEEYQDSLFLPYFSTRKEGTGLGLAIVRQIITDHHGYVRAEPNAPVGTRIVIDLPLVPV